MNASWQNSCRDVFRCDSNEIIIMEFNVMFLMLLPLNWILLVCMLVTQSKL